MLTFSLVAYIWKVCTQHMCLHVPVPLSLLPQHLLLPQVEAVFSVSGNTKDTSVMPFTLTMATFGNNASVFKLANQLQLSGAGEQLVKG